MRALHFFCVTTLAACSGFETVEKSARLSPTVGGIEHTAMTSEGAMPIRDHAAGPSLWSGNRDSLLGDRRAILPGDILTVVIEIDDQAEFSNSSARNRTASDSLGIPSLLGLPQRINPLLGDGQVLDDAVRLNSSSTSSGDGSIRRNEKLTLRVAATIVEVLPNGVLRIRGSQEVRVNFEVRELVVEGFVRPQDITRQNEIGSDKIASARISYGGRGAISSVQAPRPGQTAIEQVLPF